MEPGGGLVQQVERAAGVPAGELGGELDPLGLAPRQGRGRLAELDVVEADVVNGPEPGGDRGDVLEELERFADRHVQHVGDGFALVGDLEGLAVVAGAAADLAGDVDVGQEVHLDLDNAIPPAGLTAPAA